MNPQMRLRSWENTIKWPSSVREIKFSGFTFIWQPAPSPLLLKEHRIDQLCSWCVDNTQWYAELNAEKMNNRLCFESRTSRFLGQCGEVYIASFCGVWFECDHWLWERKVLCFVSYITFCSKLKQTLSQLVWTHNSVQKLSMWWSLKLYLKNNCIAWNFALNL